MQRKPIWNHEQIVILNWIVHIFFSLALCKTELIELIKNVCGCITIEGPAEDFIEHSGDVHVSSCHEIANMQSIFHLQTCIQSTWQSILVVRHFKHKKVNKQNRNVFHFFCYWKITDTSIYAQTQNNFLALIISWKIK